MADEELPPAVRKYLRDKGKRLGEQYGSLGGQVAAANLSAAQRRRRAKKASDAAAKALTPAERSERARKAALAMHAKKRAKKADK